jgi:hypothetical protein
MKAPTKRQQEWLWFGALWCAGLLGVALLAFAVRRVLSIP